MRTAFFYGIGAMLLGGLAVVPAHAVIINYTTAGTFGCGTLADCSIGNGGTSITITNSPNSATLAYTANSGTLLNPGPPPPQTANYGSVKSTSPLMTPEVSFTGATFTMTINETMPDDTSGNIGASLTGTVESNGSDTFIAFNNGGIISLGSVTYMIGTAGSNGVVDLISPSSGPNRAPGVTPITGYVNASAGGGGSMPEPTFMALTGLGFVGLAGMAYRRRRAVGKL
jgi:hypothetical protein